MAKQSYIRTEYEDGSVVLSNIRKKRVSIPVYGENESYTATKVTAWYDGTPMTPEKADGSVYLQLKTTEEYFRINLPNWGETFLEKNTMAQMRGLSPVEILLLKAGYYKGVGLSGYYQKGDTPGRIEYFLSSTTAADDGGSVIEVGGIKLEHIFVNSINVRYFGLKGDISQNAYEISSVLFNKAIKEKLNLYYPKGVYNCFTNNFPFKTINPFVDELMDCNFITIKGDGETTVFMTETPNGADVLNLHMVKNITFEDLSITGILTDNKIAGTNGISIVHGYDNINFNRVTIYDLHGIQKGNYEQLINKGNYNPVTNLPELINGVGIEGDYYTVTADGTVNLGGGSAVDLKIGDVVVYKDSAYYKQIYYVDGGKALTVQNDGSVNECGLLNADIAVKNCAYGFGIDYRVENFITKKTDINVNIKANRCHRTISLNGWFEDISLIPPSSRSIINVYATSIDCQEDFFGENVFGANINISINNNLNKYDVSRVPDGTRYWNSQDTNVSAIRGYNIQNTNINAYGNKGLCDAKYIIGGKIIQDVPGFEGVTKDNIFTFNVTSSSGAVMDVVNAGGNYIANTILNLVNDSIQDVPQLLFYPSRQNSIFCKDGSFTINNMFNSVKLNPDNDSTPTSEIAATNMGTTIRQLLGGWQGYKILTLNNNANSSPRFEFFEDGRFKITNDDGLDCVISVSVINPENNIKGNIGDLCIYVKEEDGVRTESDLFLKRTGNDNNTGWSSLIPNQGVAVPDGSDINILLASLRGAGFIAST